MFKSNDNDDCLPWNSRRRRRTTEKRAYRTEEFRRTDGRARYNLSARQQYYEWALALELTRASQRTALPPLRYGAGGLVAFSLHYRIRPDQVLLLTPQHHWLVRIAVAARTDGQPCARRWMNRVLSSRSEMEYNCPRNFRNTYIHFVKLCCLLSIPKIWIFIKNYPILQQRMELLIGYKMPLQLFQNMPLLFLLNQILMMKNIKYFDQ